MAPEIRPSSRPFAEALAFHRGRASVDPKTFYALVGEARTRAFTISGGLRESAILEAHQLLGRAIEENMTKQEFSALFGELLDRQDGVVLSPQRMELIWQNARATSYSVGRYRQLSRPGLIARRPIRQYPKGPHDVKTSTICRKLEGLTWRAGDPIEKHVWPPNHHHERHLDVVSMTEAQAKEEGATIYESAGEREYPVIDGQEIFPDPGWDSAPHLMAADDAEFVRQASALPAPLPSHAASDYGLGKLSDLTRAELAGAPAATPAITSLAADEYATARTAFREAFDIPEELGGSWVADYAGDGVRVTDATFDAVLGVGPKGVGTKKLAGEAVYFNHFREALEDPTEVWFERLEGGAIVKRYIKVFRGKGTKDSPTVVVLERGPGGWLMRAASQKKGAIEAARKGVLVMSKAPRTGALRAAAEGRRGARNDFAQIRPLAGDRPGTRRDGRAGDPTPRLKSIKHVSEGLRAEGRA